MTGDGRKGRTVLTPNNSRPSRDGDASNVFFRILAVLAVLFGSVTIGDLLKARQEATAQAVNMSQNVATTIAHEIARTIDLYDHALKNAIEVLSLQGIDAVPLEVRQRTVFTAPTYVSYLGVMLVTDASGKVRMESGALTPRFPDVSDRQYFRVHRQRSDLGLLVTPPFISHTTGISTIGLSRRYDGPGGTFGGVVLGALEVAYFRDLIKNVRLDAGASVAIVTDDGLVLAQNGRQALTNRGAAEGVGQRHVPETGRIQQSARAGSLPIQVTVAMPFATVYASWERNAAIIGGANMLLIAALFVVARQTALELSRRHAAEVSAAAFADDYRILADSTADIIMRLDLDGTLSYVSPAARKTLGCDPADMQGRDWTSFVVPEDWGLLATALQQLRLGADEINTTYRSTRADGSVLWLEARMRLMQRRCLDAPPEVIATLRDVTWQQEHAEQLLLLAATDGLTGVANRRRFDERLDAEWRRARRSGTALSLILLDVDEFKLYNDCYGHVGGDMVLRQIAEILQAEIKRPADQAARYGGEEFAVLLPETEATGAALVAEHIRRAVALRAIVHERSSHGIVTISLGVATLTAGTETDAAALVTQADFALYAAKQGGRNQVVSAGVTLGEKAA